MITTYFRSSSLSTLNQCEARYFFEWVLKIPTKTGQAAALGNVVHKALELLARAHFHKYETTFDGEELGELLTDLRHNPQGCLDLGFNYYKELEPHLKWDKSQYDKCSYWLDKALTMTNGQFDPRIANIHGVEYKFDMLIEEPWAKYTFDYAGERLEGYLGIKGTADLLVRVNHDTFEVRDYKTGMFREDWGTGKYKDYKYLMDDIQLRLYHYAVCKAIPEAEHVIPTIIYINAGGPCTIPLERSQLEETEDILKAYFQRIKSIENPRLNRTWKCRICGVKDTCEQLSPMFGKRKLLDLMMEYGKDGGFMEYGAGGGRQ